GNRSAMRVQKIHDKYSKMLTTILIGNNIVNIAASSLTTTMVIRFFGNALIGVATGILTLIVLLFGEIIPKTWAGAHADQVSLAYSPIIWSLMWLLTPVVFLVDHTASALIRLFHLGADKENAITAEDLRTYVDVGHEDGALEEDEHDMLTNVFDFSDAEAEDIMIPRIDMTMISVDSDYGHVRKVFQDTMYTRLPVYEEKEDHLIGMIHMKDFFFVKDQKTFQVRDILRPAHYTYQLKKTSDLLVEMREKSMSMAFVMDEYGSAVGMVTLEDLLEEIVGEIRDEYDEDEEELIKMVKEDKYLIAGSMKLDDINEALDLQLESENYDSISGLMMDQLDHVPTNHEKVTLENGIDIEVRGIYHNRISKVLLTVPKKKEEETAVDGQPPESAS
nr:hemolysin family protein [Lachnospiraceae bacterium]